MMRIDQVSLRGEIERVQSKFSDLSRVKMPAVISAAMNRTADRAATKTRRDIAAAKQIPAGVVKKKILTGKASPRRLSARVWVGLKPIPIEKLAGATYMFAGKKAGTLKAGRFAVSGVFRATMPSGGRGLFMRVLPTRQPRQRNARGDYPALPIDKPKIYLQPEAQQIAMAAMRDAATSFFPRELKRLLTLAVSRTAKRI